jgi:hypothetical protein
MQTEPKFGSQRVGVEDPVGQNDPIGQSIPAEFVGQYFPAGHGFEIEIWYN